MLPAGYSSCTARSCAWVLLGLGPATTVPSARCALRLCDLRAATALVRVHVVSCSGKRIERGLRSCFACIASAIRAYVPAKALRVLQPPLRLAMCLTASGHFSAQTTLVLIDRSACLVEPRTCDRRIKVRASRSAHGFLREPRRGVFAPRRSCTVLSLTPEKILALLLDDLFLRTVNFDLRLLVVTVGLCPPRLIFPAG